MRSPSDDFPRSRLVALVVIAGVWALLIAARLFYLQVYSHSEYKHLALQQQVRDYEVEGPRGSLLDRNGDILAMSLPVPSVAVNPMRIPDKSVAADLLAGILQVDREELFQKIQSAALTNRGFLWVKRKVSLEEAERLKTLNLDYVEFREETTRSYPKKEVAANLIGSVDHEGNGNGGIELSMQDELEGRPGTIRSVRDVRQRGFDTQVFTPPVPGKNITLTIDERVQYVAEQSLKKAVEENHAIRGTIVVMKVPSAEVLAMVSYPTFDPNQPPAKGEPLSNRLNHAVSSPFEPGSVFKVITLSSALDQHKITPETIVNCGGGRLNLFGRIIGDDHKYGALSAADVLAKSSNIGAIQIGLRLGDEKFYEYIRNYGFGKSTGLPVSAEEPGKVRPLRSWQKSSIGSVAMGHEINVTAVQLAQACFTVANNGVMIPPQLIMKMQRPGEPVEYPDKPAEKRVIRSETAVTMRNMMERVVLPGGTGTRAKLTGWSCGGKTGTAQIYDAAAGGYTKRYNSSFMGFAPVANPQVVVVVTVNGTHSYGGVASAPVFKEVTSTALRILGVPKDIPEQDMLLAKKTPAPAPVSESNDVAISSLSSGDPGMDTPELPVQNASLVSGPKVPNFRGKTMRAVLEEAAASGLLVDVEGSGIARAQMPPAGAVLARGTKIHIQFAR